MKVAWIKFVLVMTIVASTIAASSSAKALQVWMTVDSIGFSPGSVSLQLTDHVTLEGPATNSTWTVANQVVNGTTVGMLTLPYTGIGNIPVNG